MNLSDDVQSPVEKYNCLYDPYLKQHFRKKPIKDYLETFGVLTDKGRVACSLKELNDYRSYIRRNLAAHIQNNYRELDAKEKQKREEKKEKYFEKQNERLAKRNVRSQSVLRAYIKNAVSTTKPSLLENEREISRKILNAEIKRQIQLGDRFSARSERYDRLLQKNINKKDGEEVRRRKAENELLKRDKDRFEKFNKLKEVAELERKLKKEAFWDRKIASQLEWLKEGQRLDNKYRKEHKARVQFLNENKRLPFTFIPEDKEDVKNKIYLLSKEEEKAEKEVMQEEEAQSQSEYISRDNLETDRGPIEDSSDEALEDSDKSRPESEEVSESRNVE